MHCDSKTFYDETYSPENGATMPKYIVNKRVTRFFVANRATTPIEPGPPHCRRFTITLSNTTFGRTPLDG